MEMLLEGKEMGQTGEWGDTASSQGSSPQGLCLQGKEGKERKLPGRTRKGHPGKGEDTQGGAARGSKGQQVEQMLSNSLSEQMGDFTH